MASWSDVEKFIVEKYSAVKKENGTWMSVFPIKDDRTQVVIFSKNIDEDKGDVWLDMQSPIGELSSLEKVDAALSFLANLRCGGLIKVGDVYALRHGIPIADLSTNEIETPLFTICFVADCLEKALLGNDIY